MSPHLSGKNIKICNDKKCESENCPPPLRSKGMQWRPSYMNSGIVSGNEILSVPRSQKKS